MTIVEVSIERDNDGWLHGYVIQRAEDQDGNEVVHKGPDLLKRGFYRTIDSARNECDGKIAAIFKLLAPPKVEYIYPYG